MRFGVVSRVDKKEAVDVAKKVIDFLSDKAGIVVENSLGEKIGKRGVELKKMDVDIIVTVGGDGTILRTLQSCDIPVFGVNAGAMGFLTETKPENMLFALGRLLKKDYIIDSRIKLEVKLNRKKVCDCTNEAVLHTSHIAKMRRFEIYIDDKMAEDIRADGIIVATPTGSTCYAMSAGSPILDSRVNAFVIAPIAPFKLSARPIVVPASSRIRIRIDKGDCLLVLDGQYEKKIRKDDTVSFTVSRIPARFVRFDHDFYKRIREGLIL